jgi:hypothetical protein
LQGRWESGYFYENLDKFRNAEIGLKRGSIKAVFKNGYRRITNQEGDKVPFESDIFAEGVAPLVQSSIVAQTFGAPAAYPPECDGSYNVGNSREIQVGRSKWKQGSDHSKWAYATDSDYACFGDLNRNTYRQTVRGGAFYCVPSAHLRNALQALTPNPDVC